MTWPDAAVLIALIMIPVSIIILFISKNYMEYRIWMKKAELRKRDE